MNLSLPLFDLLGLPDPPAPWPGASPAGPTAEPGPAPAAGWVDRAARHGQALQEGQDEQAGRAGLANLAGPVDASADAAPDTAEADVPAAPLHWPSERLLDRPDPLQLHPGLWRAHQVGAGVARTTATGFAALDAELPGGGWPHAVLTELLLAQPGIGELRLLAPALAALTPLESGPGLAADVPRGPGGSRARSGGPAGAPAGAPAGGSAGGSAVGRSLGGLPPARSGGRADGRPGGSPLADASARCVMLFDPPARLSAWALAQQGLHAGHWLVVQPRLPQRHPRAARGLAPLLPAADLLWALEQALRSGHVGAVLAWLPLQLRADALRRLQLAAQAHDGPVFVFRDAQTASRPSPAPLRLLLQPAGVDGLALRLLKRRGPPLAQALTLRLPPVLTPRQQAQAATRRVLAEAQRAALRSL